MVKRIDGWLSVAVRACLEGMGELDEDEDGEELRTWLNADVRGVFPINLSLSIQY